MHKCNAKRNEVVQQLHNNSAVGNKLVILGKTLHRRMGAAVIWEIIIYDASTVHDHVSKRTQGSV